MFERNTCDRFSHKEKQGKEGRGKTTKGWKAGRGGAKVGGKTPLYALLGGAKIGSFEIHGINSGH